MDEDINFCPFCDAPGHKIIIVQNNMNLCKGCDRFFSIDVIKLKCPKCGADKIIHSDFPSPAGEMVLQCKSCKKMYAAGELIKKNEKM